MLPPPAPPRQRLLIARLTQLHESFGLRNLIRACLAGAPAGSNAGQHGSSVPLAASNAGGGATAPGSRQLGQIVARQEQDHECSQPRKDCATTT